MAEEEAAVEEKKAGGIVALLLGKVGVAIAIVLMAAIAAMLVFIFVVRPRLMAPEENVDPHIIPADIINVQFEEAFASLIMSDPNIPSSTLLYQVSVSCSNTVASELVSAHEDRFIDRIRELHHARTREEIDDPMVVEGIKKQMVQELNKILRQVQATNDESVRIIDVHYRKFFASDL